MKNLLAVLFSFIKNNVITQDFKMEDYGYFISIPFTKCDIWLKGIRPVIRYRGEECMRQRNQYMLDHHGMSWEDTQKEENAHLFVAKVISYKMT